MGRKISYPLILIALWISTGPYARAQEPLPETGAQRVSGGTVERVVSEVTDSLPVRTLQSPIFRDTMPISRVSAISLGVPGFAQLYNRDYWKIPVLYGTVGTMGYFAVDANKKFQRYKRQFDMLILEYRSIGETNGSQFIPDVEAQNAFFRDQIEPVSMRMNKYNTQRTVYFAGAALTYLYFLGDGVLNYPHPATNIKRATTLALMCPGAGQLYNKSYWKVPIVVGAFATMGFLIDWNNRAFQRFRNAYIAYPNDEFGGRYTQSRLLNERDRFRRDRDLCIILTGAAYLLSVIEAHVDAHFKNFDVSDDLSMRLEPSLIDLSNYHSPDNAGYPGVGLSMRINF